MSEKQSTITVAHAAPWFVGELVCVKISGRGPHRTRWMVGGENDARQIDRRRAKRIARRAKEAARGK